MLSAWWIDKDTGGDVSSSIGSYATLLVAPRRKKIKPRGFALTAAVERVASNKFDMGAFEKDGFISITHWRRRG